jgi:multiple antibiotic resistance protein
LQIIDINWGLISNFAIVLMAIVNPVEKIPLWVQASKCGQQGFKWLLAAMVILSSAVILLIFLWFGNDLLMQLKIELASFKIGGGLILLQFGFSMLRGTAVELESEQVSESNDLKHRVLNRYQQIFTPLGVPV